MPNNFKQYLQSKDFSKTTVSRYVRDTLNFLSWLDNQNIEAENATSSAITGYLQHLQKKGCSSNTRAAELNAIRHFFDWQIEQERRTENPAKYLKIRGIKRQTLYYVFSPTELKALVSAYKMPTQEDEIKTQWWYEKYTLSRKRDHVVLSLLIYQGLSTSDINRLQKTDIDLKGGIIKISGSRKSAARELELKSYQMLELMEYTLQVREKLMEYNNITSEDLFPCSNHRQKNINLFRRLSRELKELNSNFTNLQQIRNSVITHWLGQYNLRKVQQMAGHKHIHSTESYRVNQLEDLQADIEKFHPMG